MSIRNNLVRFFVLILVILVMVSLRVYAQEDSVYTSTYSTSKESFRKEKRFRYLDQTLFERKTLYKLRVEVGQLSPDRLSVERKLWPSSSIEVGWGIPKNSTSSVFGQFRYYPSKRQNAPESRKKINNFTGNYFKIGGTRVFDTAPSEFFDRSFSYYGVGFGHQHKVGKWGFFDISANLQYITGRYLTDDILQFSLQLDVGPAYGKSRGESYGDEDKFDDFKSSYVPKNHLIKVSNPFLGISKNFAGLGMSLSYEQKVTPNISVNSRVNFGVSTQNIFSFNQPNEEIEFRSLSSGLDLELRYYYSRNKRLQKGADVRDFSGPYFAAGARNLYLVRDSKVLKGEVPSFNQRFFGDFNGFDFAQYEVTWGIQKRIGTRGFLNLGASVVYDSFDQRIDLLLRSEIGITIGK